MGRQSKLKREAKRRAAEQAQAESRRVREHSPGYPYLPGAYPHFPGHFLDFDRGGPGFGYGRGGFGYPTDRRQDRTQSPRPFMTEAEYFVQVALARELVADNDLAIGYRDRVRDYTGPTLVSFVLEGDAPGAAPAGPVDSDGNGVPDVHPAVRACESAWKEFQKANDWGRGAEDREEEAGYRLIVEGEVTLRLFKGGPGEVPQARFVEPEFIRSPPGASDEERWGIINPRGDAETCIGILIQKDPADPTDFVEVKPDRFVRAKRNVDRSCKRGLSDFAPTAETLRATVRLLDNLAVVGGVQSATAWIEEYGPAATQDHVRSIIEAGKKYDAIELTPFGGASTVPVQTNLPGTVKHVEAGRQFKPGPTSAPAGFLEIVESCMHRASVRFGLPANFAWGNADSYASVLVTNAPFVKAIKTRQNRQNGFTELLVERVLALCEESGRLPRGISKAVRIVCDSEPVIIADEAKQAMTKISYFKEGLYDPQRIMRENGDEPAVVYANVAAHAKRVAANQQAPQRPPGGGGGNPFDGGNPTPGPTPAPPGSAGGDGSSPNNPFGESLSEGRKEGEIWQGPSGRWFRILHGRAVPYARDPGDEPAAGGEKGAASAGVQEAAKGLASAITSSRNEGGTTIPDVVDAALKEVPGATVEGVHAALLKLRDADVVQLMVSNDPHFMTPERRAKFVHDPNATAVGGLGKGKTYAFILPLVPPGELAARIAAVLAPAAESRAGGGGSSPNNPFGEGVVREGYSEKDHPRDDRGRFVDKDEIEFARDDPEVAAQLRAKVTDPAERAKLDAMIGGKGAPAAKEPEKPAARPKGSGEPNPHVPDQARPPLSADEVAAVEAYTGWDYGPINKALREGREPASAESRATHAALQKAFAKAKPLARPVEAHRALALSNEQLAAFVEGAQKAAESGHEFPMGGYVSTTVDPAYKPDPNANVHVVIAATRGLDLTPHSEFGDQEKELLLNHGSKFRVRGVERVGKGWRVHMEQVA